MTCIPNFIRRRVEHNPKLIGILANVSWLLVDKILRMGLGLLIVILLARYLGPEEFGLFSFLTAFTALFGVIAALGLPSIAVREVVRDPETADVTLITVAVLQLVGGLFAYLLALGTASYMRPDDEIARAIVAILGLMMLIKASDVVLYWFESQVQSKYTVWAQTSTFILFASIKIGLIIHQVSLTTFVWVMLVEALFGAIILIIVMQKYGPKLSFDRFNLAQAKTFLKDSWPLILSGLAVSVYMRIDQIMLGQMIDDQAVGIYSAASRISEAWYFIPMVVATSFFPEIFEAKTRSEAEYYTRLQKLYDLMVVISILVALPMTLLSAPLMTIFFGQAYSESGVVLAIHVWGTVFVFLGVASEKWYLAENQQLLGLQRTLLGAVVNVLMNLVLIPHYQAVGAAIATVISYAVAALVTDVFHSATRKMFFMKLSSFNPIALWDRSKL